jgi:hypothetical protein
VNPSTFASTLAWAQQRKIAVIVVGPVAEYKGPLPLILALPIKNNDPQAIRRRLSPGINVLDAMLERTRARLHYQYLSPYQTLCSDGSCMVYADTKEEIPMLSDSDHLTNAGAAWLVSAWVRDNKLR